MPEFSIGTALIYFAGGILLALWLFTIDWIIYEPRKRQLILFFGIPVLEVCKDFGKVNDDGTVKFTPSFFWHRLPFYPIFWPFFKWKEENNWKVFSDKGKIDQKEYLTLDENDAPEGETEVLALGSDMWTFLLREETRGIKFNTITNDGTSLALRIVVQYQTLSLETTVNVGVKDWDETVAAARIEDIVGSWSRTHSFDEVMAASNETSKKIEVHGPQGKMDLIPFLSLELRKYGIAVCNLNFRPPKISKLSEDRINMSEEVKIAELDAKKAEHEAKRMETIGEAEAKVLQQKLDKVYDFSKKSADLEDKTQIRVAEHWSKLPGTYVNLGSEGKQSGLPSELENLPSTIVANLITKDKKGGGTK